MAGNTMKMTLEGAKELTMILSMFKPSVRRRLARPGVAKGARIVAKSAKQNVPVARGFLKRAIGTKTATYKSGTVAAFAGVRSPSSKTGKSRNSKFDKEAKAAGVNPSKYAHLVEFGTKPHKVGTGTHPGTAAQPFMRPAFDQNLFAIKRIMQESLKENIQKEVAKRVVKRIAG